MQIDGCGIWNLRGIDHDDSAELRDRVIVWHGENYPSSKTSFPIIDCKPYLFPMSSMTEEQKKDYRKVCELDAEIFSKLPMDRTSFPALYNSQDWLNKNHFDY